MVSRKRWCGRGTERRLNVRRVVFERGSDKGEGGKRQESERSQDGLSKIHGAKEGIKKGRKKHIVMGFRGECVKNRSAERTTVGCGGGVVAVVGKQRDHPVSCVTASRERVWSRFSNAVV